MRRFLVLFMILLPPLRVWAGGAMSVTMALEQAMPDGDAVAMAADCPMQGQWAADPQDSGQSAPSNTGCDSCELCLPFTQAVAVDLDALPALPHVKPLSLDSEPPSAPLALSFKPPIS